MTIQPITNTFGNYPHSYDEIMAERDPQRAYILLSTNLKWSIGSRPRDMRILKGAMHRKTEKKLQKLIRSGWMVDGMVREPFLRRVQYTMVRPQVTQDEAKFLGWSK